MASDDKKQGDKTVEAVRVVNYKVIDNNGKTVINANLRWPSVNPNIIQLMEGLAVDNTTIDDPALLNYSGTFYGKYGWFISTLAGITVDGKTAYWNLAIDGTSASVGPSYHTIGAMGTDEGMTVTWTYTPLSVEKDLTKDVHP